MEGGDHGSDGEEREELVWNEGEGDVEPKGEG